MDININTLDVATTSKYGLENPDETESETRYNEDEVQSTDESFIDDEVEIKHDSNEEDEILRLEAKESLRRASIALQAYKEIPEASRKGEFSEYNTYLHKKTAERRKIAQKSYSFNGYDKKSSLPSESDFDVATILKNQSSRNENTAFDVDDYYYTTLRNKLPTDEPSGLVETKKWETIMQRFESYKSGAGATIAAKTHDPQNTISMVVSRRPSYPVQVTRTVEMQDLQGSDTSIRTFCAVCDRYVQTLITYDYGIYTFLAFFVCCFVIPIFIVCAWIPFLFTGFMDVKHACPKCGTTLGIYKRV